MTNRDIHVKPGPKVLAAALMLAGFSPDSKYPAVTDQADVEWPEPSGLQIALALCGGESSGDALTYHVNNDGSIDYGLLEIDNTSHAAYYEQYGPDNPTAWNWQNYLDNARAAYEIHESAQWSWEPWVAYTGGGYLKVRYGGRSWMDWANHGIQQMQASLKSLTAKGKTQEQALIQLASIDNDPLVYWE